MEARAAVGDAVLFVPWFNFVAGFAYVAAGVGLFSRQSWAIRLSVAILVATVLVMIAFGVHAAFGGAYEIAHGRRDESAHHHLGRHRGHGGAQAQAWARGDSPRRR